MSVLPKVSVIIPVFNVENYLKECLDSILNQAIRDIEIICINDGSTDGSTAILAEYLKLDDRISVITQENKGLSAARNVGLSLANGTYIYFMDGDDLLLPDALLDLYSAAEREKLDVVYFDASVIYENDMLAEKYKTYTTTYSYKRKQSYGGPIDGPSMYVAMSKNSEYRSSMCLQLIRNEHLARNNLRLYEGIIHEDQLFNFRCMLQAERVLHVNKPYFIRRIRTGSIMTQNSSFKHFHGYLVCFVHIQLHMISHYYNDEVQVCVNGLLENLRSSMIGLYQNSDSPDTWLSALSLTEQYFARFYITQPIEKATLQADVRTLNEMIAELEAEKASLLESAVSRPCDGTCYYGQIGRRITWVPRKTQGGIRCIREHGFLYTIGLVGKKLFSKLRGAHRK